MELGKLIDIQQTPFNTRSKTFELWKRSSLDYFLVDGSTFNGHTLAEALDESSQEYTDFCAFCDEHDLWTDYFLFSW